MYVKRENLSPSAGISQLNVCCEGLIGVVPAVSKRPVPRLAGSAAIELELVAADSLPEVLVILIDVGQGPLRSYETIS